MKYIFFLIIILILGCQPPLKEGLKVQSESDGPIVMQLNEVKITRNYFQPNSMLIPAGSSVSWLNTDNKIHVIRNDKFTDITFQIHPGEHIEQTLNEPGVYEIIDVNFGSKMIIRVQ